LNLPIGTLRTGPFFISLSSFTARCLAIGDSVNDALAARAALEEVEPQRLTNL